MFIHMLCYEIFRIVYFVNEVFCTFFCTLWYNIILLERYLCFSQLPEDICFLVSFTNAIHCHWMTDWSHDNDHIISAQKLH